MYLTLIARLICAIILCQYISINYFSIYKIYSPLSYLLNLVFIHRVVLWYLNKKEETADEKSEVNNSVKEELESYIYEFGLAIYISYTIETLSGSYFAANMANTLQQFNEQGLTKAQVFNWRCSGAYSFAYSCDKKEMEKDFNNEGLVGNAVRWAHVTTNSYNEQTSGIIISCSPGHAKIIMEAITEYKWDGPSPIHSEEDCIASQLHTFKRYYIDREVLMDSTIKSKITRPKL